ncbi:kinase [Frondihabitans sucicola]|uniref:Kinase n=1 Tax=Frondihabitans sucicola TaxID=1268041 RepID=A0ABN6XWA9_9MICO|nr:BadF/BadG/BcrA/BcrD ATPase family protein [Frondihabitans sucicola]BDZ49196.1 kinase [Frondihabitans sucicola]
MTSPHGAEADAGRRDVVLAVDGGGSKTDVVAVTVDGDLVGHARGPGSNPQVLGLDEALEILDRLRDTVLRQIGDVNVVETHVYLSGLDLPAEIAAASVGLAHWSADVIDNDLFALLRGGLGDEEATGQDAVAVVCGTGINAIGVRHDGATARFPALGDISGDWGGGSFLGGQALWHAARAEDGRGPSTRLQQDVPEALGFETVRDVTEALHFRRIDFRVVSRLSPVLFAASAAGDEVASRVVDQQADEIVTLTATALKRLDLLDVPVPVVLGGGVLAARHPRLLDGIDSGLAARALATTRVVSVPPLLGAGLLALEHAGAVPAALDRYRAAVLAQSWMAAGVSA